METRKAETRRSHVGLVIVGRNEGDRLANCLAHALALDVPVVYVDSGSHDGSPELARRQGADVLELDAGRPFTAARARNEGFGRLVAAHPHVRHVQFLDGDCELVPSWLERASATLEARSDVVVVAGRLRERHPDASIYNRLCELEWNVPDGEATSCGGNCMVRTDAFDRIGGFDASLIAGEEPELAWRLRRAGGKVLHLQDEMATHDAALRVFAQWWRRQVRAGHATSENADLHGREDRRYYVQSLVSNLAYGLALPVLALGLVPFTGGSSLLLMLAYARLYARVRTQRLERGDLPAHAAAYARYLLLGKFAQAAGTLVYVWQRKLRRRTSTLIEYKHLVPRTSNRAAAAGAIASGAIAKPVAEPRL